MRLEDRLASVAARQYGLLTHAQARAAGCSDDAIRARTRSGRWLAPHRRVYAVAGAPRGWPQTVLAACLAAGDPVAASHRTAAALWGLRADPPGAVDLLTPRRRRVRLDGVAHHSTLLLPMSDVTHHGPVPVTTVARTLVDVAGTLRGDRLGRAIDDALRRQLLRLDDLSACVARFDGAHGRALVAVRAALAERLPRDPGDSDGELWILGVLLRAGLPTPVQQHPVVLEGRRRRIDLAYPEQGVAIEFDGFHVHTLKTVFDDEKARAGALAAAGWTVLPFTSATPEGDIVRRTRLALERAGDRRSA